MIKHSISLKTESFLPHCKLPQVKGDYLSILHHLPLEKACQKLFHVHLVSARQCLDFWHSTDCVLLRLCSSLNCFVLSSYGNTGLCWCSQTNRGCCSGEKAEASWNDLLGLIDSWGWEFKGSFVSLVFQWGPITVEHSHLFVFQWDEIYSNPEWLKIPNSEMMPLVRNFEECSAVNNSHMPSKWSHAIKQCILIVQLTTHSPISDFSRRMKQRVNMIVLWFWSANVFKSVKRNVCIYVYIWLEEINPSEVLVYFVLGNTAQPELAVTFSCKCTVAILKIF